MNDTITVTVEDCPTDDVAEVVSGGPVSNALVLYVRRWMSAKRQDTAALFEGYGDPPKAERDAIFAAVSDACGLTESTLWVAYSIAEAAGWDHLAGAVPS